MKHTFDLPPIMKHLKLDERGYPIPFFVPIVNGKPEFRYQDGKKQKLALEKKLCSICGKKLYKGSYWIITGPIGFNNCVASDPPMHEDCARFSLMACPHIAYQYADRRTEAPVDAPQLSEKPSEIILIQANKYRVVEGKNVYRFRPVYLERYEYINGKLTKTNLGKPD